ncbi:MAG: OadG family protein [Bacteroidales bacterium]|nr:OadG family protein [Bacteroidales bacterium]
MIINTISFDFSAITGFEIIVAVVGYVIVFSALVIMYYVYNNIPKLINIKIRQRLEKEGKYKISENEELHIPGDVNAAISMALYLYFNELHDKESNIITIKKVSKQYSPWSSKIYGLNE